MAPFNALPDRLLQAMQPPARGHAPLYRRLAQGLRDAISTGALVTGQHLPPEREIAGQLGLSRVTVRHAIAELVDEGLLHVRQGAGTFVSGRIEQALSHLGSFTEDMLRRGHRPGSRWLRRERALAGPDEWVALGLSAHAHVVRTERVRTADGEPLAIERACVAADCVGDTAEFGESLYAAMERHGARPVRGVQRVRAGTAEPEDAALLGLPPGAPVLITERRSFGREGRPLELTRSIYRGDRYDYVVELRSAAETPGT